MLRASQRNMRVVANLKIHAAFHRNQCNIGVSIRGGLVSTLFLGKCQGYVMNIIKTMTYMFRRCVFNMSLHSETQVSGRLGMSGGRSPRHAQNPLSGEQRKMLWITHHALSPPPSHIICTTFISSIDYNVFIVLQCHLKRPFVPKSDVKQWFTTTTRHVILVDTPINLCAFRIDYFGICVHTLFSKDDNIGYSPTLYGVCIDRPPPPKPMCRLFLNFTNVMYIIS